MKFLHSILAQLSFKFRSSNSSVYNFLEQHWLRSDQANHNLELNWYEAKALSQPDLMIEFFLPNFRALLPTFCTNCPDGSHFAQMGSHFAQNTTTNACSLLCRHKPLSGICTNTKHSQPYPKTPLFLAWTWKWTKWTAVWAKWTPSVQNVWKVGKTFLEVGTKTLFIQIWAHS